MERAALVPLIILAVATATAFLFPPFRLQLWRLLRRTRWLLAVLLLTYAYVLPGTALWPELAWASPSVEGLQQGVLRTGRLALMLAGLALLLATTSRSRLIYGLYVLARPLSGLGFDRRAFAVRLGLTLDYVERANEHRDARSLSPPSPACGRGGQGRRARGIRVQSAHWLEALRLPQPDDATPDTYTLEAEHWQSRDSIVILAGLFLLWMILG